MVYSNSNISVAELQSISTGMGKKKINMKSYYSSGVQLLKKKHSRFASSYLPSESRTEVS